MKFIYILWSNIKRILKNKKMFISAFLIPLAVMLAFGFILNKVDDHVTTAVVNSDKGTYGKEFIDEIKNNTDIKIYEKDDAAEMLKSKKISNFYKIPDNFSEIIKNEDKPEIICYEREKGNSAGDFQFYANSLINKMILREEMKKQGVNLSLKGLNSSSSKIEVSNSDKQNISDQVVMNIFISFLLYTSIAISMELLNLKGQNILKRGFTTANKPGTIIGSVLLALLIVSTVRYFLVYVINCIINSPSHLKNSPIMLLNIILLTLVSLSIGTFITRICRNPGTINIVLQIMIGVSCFVGGSFMPIEYLPSSISAFSKFTPQYWALNSINTGNAAPALMVLLFSLVFFTAGTYKVKDF